jgi:Polyketide cyclase / dehydrase and lipid transport
MTDSDKGHGPKVDIEIDAPAQIVWDVLTDFARYEEWNPLTVRVETNLRAGEMFKLWGRSGETGQVAPYDMELMAYKPPHLISWGLPQSAGYPFWSRRDQIVEAVGAERSAYKTTDLVFGAGAEEFLKSNFGWIEAGIRNVATALKKRAEQIHAEHKG